jgi:hypothetical protein
MPPSAVRHRSVVDWLYVLVRPPARLGCRRHPTHLSIALRANSPKLASAALAAAMYVPASEACNQCASRNERSADERFP